MPIMTNRDASGFVYVQRKSSGKFLTSRELAMIEAFILESAIVIENRLLHRSNVRDSLLDVYNLDYFKKRLAEELQRCLRYRKPVSVMLVDIDDFKRINSLLAYAGGNAVLQNVVHVIRESIRNTDILARYSADQFSVLLTESDHEAAVRAASRLRDKVEKTVFGFGEKKLNLTVSIGLVSCSSDRLKVIEDFIDEAENALLIAKKRGGNQISYRHDEEKKHHEELTLIAECQPMKNIIAMIGRLAKVDATVLLTGETGTGKEVVARLIHQKSNRRDKPFVVVNCGAIPENLLESELFGHERGSFTGAYTTQKGKFELGNLGTIFLDEIAELPIHLQPKLLHAVEEGKIDRIGGKAPIPIDVRIIAATNKNLEMSVNEGKFRQDLFYRLNVISLHLPALRNRKNDTLLLAEYFSRRFALSYNKPIKGFTAEANACLLAYHWPGNVRELSHLIERAVIMDLDGYISPDDLSLKPAYLKVKKLEEIKHEVEKDAIRDALSKNRGNISRTSRELGITRVTLKSMLKKFNIKSHDFRGG